MTQPFHSGHIPRELHTKEIFTLPCSLLSLQPGERTKASPTIAEWIMKTWRVCKTHYYLALKKNEVTKFSGKLMDLGCIISGEVTQSQKEKYYIIFPHVNMSLQCI